MKNNLGPGAGSQISGTFLESQRGSYVRLLSLAGMEIPQI